MELPVVLPNNLLASAQNNHQLAIKRREERSFAEKYKDAQKQIDSFKAELIVERQRSTDLAKQLKEAQDTIRQLERGAKTGAVSQPAQQPQQAVHVPLQPVGTHHHQVPQTEQRASVQQTPPSPRDDFYRGPSSAPNVPSQPAKHPNPYDDEDEMPMPGQSSRPAARTPQQTQQQPNPFFDGDDAGHDPFGSSGAPAPPPPPSGGLSSGIQGFDRSKLHKTPQNTQPSGGAPKQQPQSGFGGNFAMEAQQVWQQRAKK